ncbi:MAG TPA: hypothetical protein VGX28_15230 [Frankiaceae bacterium]|nr:hypothetical protein [Frankiaceae bacterium]
MTEDVVAAVAEVYARHARPWLVGLVAFGSYVRGDIVPGSSDLDLRLYLAPEAFDGDHLPWPLVRAIHADLAAVDAVPFAYVQCHATRADAAEPLVPGTWRLLEGTCPAPEATADDVRAGAARTLERVRRARPRACETLLDSGGGRLEREVRLLATDVWPALYATLVTTADDPLPVWTLPKRDAIERLTEPAGSRARAFHDALTAYHAGGATPAGALRAIDAGLAFLTEVTT